MTVGATGPRSALHLDSRSTGGVAATRHGRCPLCRSAASENSVLVDAATSAQAEAKGERRRCVSCAAPAKLRVRAGGRGLRGGATRSRRVAARRVCAARWRGVRGGPARKERDGGGCEGLCGARGRLRGARGGLRGGATVGREGGGCAEGLRGGRAGDARRGYAEGREAGACCAEGREAGVGCAEGREGAGCAEGLRGGRAGAARRGYAEGREAGAGCAEGRQGWRRAELRGCVAAARRLRGVCASPRGGHAAAAQSRAPRVDQPVLRDSTLFRSGQRDRPPWR